MSQVVYHFNIYLYGNKLIMSKKWTKEEDELLSKIYPSHPTEIVKKSFDRSWDAIKLHAEKMKLKRNIVDTRDGSMENLLLENVNAYYWIGFIMADGYINHKTYRLKVTLSSKDRNHLIKLQQFLNKTKISERILETNYYSSIDIQDKIKMIELINKFDFKQNKTLYPPNNILWMNNNLFIAFLCGFIDGDGYIRKVYNRNDSSISIKIHKNWLGILKQFTIKIKEIYHVEIPEPKINKAGYALLHLSNIKLLRKLKLNLIELNIPFLKRKWDLIDEGLVSKYEISEKRNESIKKYLKENKSIKEIAQLLNMTYSGVYSKLKSIS